jgi:hypothetical protein
MNHAEKLAQALVQAVVSGSRMVYRLDQSRSVHDFDLHHSDGRVAAVEVTASVDEAGERTNAAILDKKKGGPVVKIILCKNGWRIYPGLAAKINKIREKADEYLAAIELDGLKNFSGPKDRSRYPSVERIYRDLGVISGATTSSKEPGCIELAPPGRVGSVGVGLVLEAVKHETFKDDNRKKLGSVGTDERHLLVYVHPGNYLVWYALRDLEPPPDLADLPPEITDVWAFSETESDHECVVWRGGVISAWHSLGRVTVKLSN